MWFLVVLTIVFSLVFTPDILAHSETVIIKMTASGFEPQSITVDQNSTVLFVNEDKVDHWPASNIHPTHDIYPEFDPKKPIEPSASWPFKPKQAGEWKYHDHLLPHIRGTLIVQSEGNAETQKGDTETRNIFSVFFTTIRDFFVNFYQKFTEAISKGKPAKTLEPSAFSKLSSQDQFKALEDMAKSKGASLVWEYIKNTFKDQAGSSGNIHDLAHFTGGLIYEKEDFPGLSRCSPHFAFGCYHGFLDKAFQKNLDDLERAESSCRNLGAGGPSASCIHGIGHGIASFYQTNNLKAALTSCKRLTASALQYCFDGVFMEFERSSAPDLYSKENPYKPCDELEKEFGEEFSFACGRNQPTVLMSRFKFSFEDVIGICLKSPSNQFKLACFDALGFIVTKSTSQPNAIVASCQKIGIDEYIVRCAKAASGELIFQEVPGWQQNAPAVCQLLATDYQNNCHQYIQQLIKQYGRLISSDDEAKFIRDKLKVCFESNGKDGCYKDVAALFFNQFGLKKTLRLFKDNEAYPEVYARCHEVTHYLSRLEYERLGSIAGVYAQCDSTCHGGCYHGTLEAYLKAKNLKDNDLKKEFVKVCGIKENHPSPLVFNECFHGLGHAAMFIKDMELKESLELCDTISSQEYKERCFTGVFMENSSSSTSFDHTSKYIKPDDPFYPCNDLEEKYLTICWRYQSSYFAVLLHDNWPEVSKLCLKIPQNYQSECFRTIGTNQVGFTQNPAVMKANCELVPNEDLQRVCIVGIVSSFGYRFVGDPSKMIQFCSLVSQGDKEGCFRQIGASFLDWSDDKELAKKECGKIEDRMGSSFCLSVI